MKDQKVKLKPVVTYRLSGEAESHSATLLKTRDLMDVSDEPLERGGTNEGFAPTEFVLGGLAACSNVISHKIAKKEGFNIHALNVDVKAQFNRLGVNLRDHIRVPFPEIKLSIRVVSDADKKQQETLQQDLQKFCAIANIIRESGTKIVEDWTFEETASD